MDKKFHLKNANQNTKALEQATATWTDDSKHYKAAETDRKRKCQSK